MTMNAQLPQALTRVLLHVLAGTAKTWLPVCMGE
jgi:hypothetical protein